jgi:hypothetical protein
MVTRFPKHFGLAAFAACGRTRKTATSATVEATTMETLLV